MSWAVVVVLAAADPTPAPKAPKATKELLAKGKAVYETTCLACHGAEGHGDGPAGVVLTPRPRDFAKDPFKQGSRPEDVFKTLSEGVAGTPMVAQAQLSDDDRWAVALYVLEWVPKANRGKRPPPPPAPAANAP